MNTLEKYHEFVENGQLPVLTLTTCAKVCNECLFSNQSLKGWLGCHSVESIQKDLRLEMLFSCHLQRKDNLDQNIAEVQNGQQNICRGFLLSAIKSFKLFGSNPISGLALKELTKSMQIKDSELETILDIREFEKHHSNG